MMQKLLTPSLVVILGAVLMIGHDSALADPPPKLAKGLKYARAKLTKMERDAINKEYHFSFDDGGKKKLAVLRVPANASWESPVVGGKKYTLTAKELATRFGNKKVSREYWIVIREKGRLVESVVAPAASAKWDEP